MKKQILTIFLCIAMSRCALAFYDDPFRASSAAAIALGDAYTAAAEDESAVTYNPAGLAAHPGSSISVSGNYEERPGFYDKGMEVSVRINNFGLNFFKKYELFEISQYFPKEPSSRIMSFTAACGFEIVKDLKIGAAVKYLNYENQTAFGHVAEGFSADLGLSYKFSENVNASFLFRNIFARFNGYYFIQIPGNSVNTAGQIVPGINLGISIVPAGTHRILIECKDIFSEQLADELFDHSPWIMIQNIRSIPVGISYHAGYEFSGINNLKIKCGLFWKNKIGVAFGAGYSIYGFKIDIAAANDLRAENIDHNAVQYYLNFGYEW